MSTRNKMVDNSQLFTAYHYKVNDVTNSIDLENDISTPFEFEWVDDVKDETQLMAGRFSKSSNATIKTDYEELSQQDIVVINDEEYNVSKINPIHNGAFDLRALRGGVSNISYIVELDT